MYCTGGLEPSRTDRDDVMTINNTKYLLTDKFKTRLRDSLIDWGTFLEVYNDTLTENNMLKHVVKLLNIKENKNKDLQSMMIPLLKKVHGLPAKAHLTCMMRQFMIYEPVSVAIQAIFGDLKEHYEMVVRMFVSARNEYIKKHKVDAKINDWEKLTKYWDKFNEHHEFESSSVILLMLNPPKVPKYKLELKTKNMESVIEPLVKAIKGFKYPGFCPKVPHVRLRELLKFPINAFVTALRAFDKTVKLPDYKKIEEKILKLLTVEKMPIIEDIAHNELPKSLSKDVVEMAKWYVTDILEYRKKLLKSGREVEMYYINIAKKLSAVHDVLQEELYLPPL